CTRDNYDYGWYFDVW
nr:immunoglobulin heavy chain junction region [Mus musculus]